MIILHSGKLYIGVKDQMKGRISNLLNFNLSPNFPLYKLIVTSIQKMEGKIARLQLKNNGTALV